MKHALPVTSHLRARLLHLKESSRRHARATSRKQKDLRELGEKSMEGGNVAASVSRTSSALVRYCFRILYGGGTAPDAIICWYPGSLLVDGGLMGTSTCEQATARRRV